MYLIREYDGLGVASRLVTDPTVAQDYKNCIETDSSTGRLVLDLRRLSSQSQRRIDSNMFVITRQVIDDAKKYGSIDRTPWTLKNLAMQVSVSIILIGLHTKIVTRLLRIGRRDN